MATIGTMTVDVRADVAKMSKDLEKIKKKTRKSANSMKKSFNGVKIALASVFSAGAVVAGIKKTIDSLDKVNKAASKLGTTTEQLSSLAFAAERAGIDANLFENSMQRLSRRSAEATVGLGEARMALKELGIDAKNFADISLEEKMYTLADAFQGVTSEQDQLRIAFKLFDTEGAKLVNMLKNGSTEIKEFQGLSDKLGKTLKSSVAADASRAADAITNFSAAFDGITNSLAQNFLPMINKALNAVQDFFGIERIVKVNELKEKLAEARIELERLQNIRWKGGDIFPKKLEKAKNAVIDLGFEIEALEEKNKKTSEFKLASSESIDTLNKYQASLKTLKAEFDPMSKLIQDTNEKFLVLDEALTRGDINENQYSVMMDNLNESTIKAYDTLQTLQEPLTKIQELGVGVADSIGNSMLGAFDSMMEGAFSFKDTMKSLLKDVLKELIKVFVIQQAVGALKGSFGVPTQSATVGMASQPTFGQSSFGAQSMLDPKQFFAKGGIVNSPTNFMDGTTPSQMGEKGAEMIAPIKRMPNGDMGVGASPVNIEIINNAGASVSAQRDGDSIKVMIEKVESSIAGGIRKGTGPVGSAIQGMKQQGRL